MFCGIGVEVGVEGGWKNPVWVSVCVSVWER